MPTDYEAQQIAEIENWMGHSPDILSRVADGVLGPITGVLARVIPEAAILGALRARWINILICEQFTAERLCAE